MLAAGENAGGNTAPPTGGSAVGRALAAVGLGGTAPGPLFAVSYTHLKLAASDLMEILVGAGSIKKKTTPRESQRTTQLHRIHTTQALILVVLIVQSPAMIMLTVLIRWVP